MFLQHESFLLSGSNCSRCAYDKHGHVDYPRHFVRYIVCGWFWGEGPQREQEGRGQGGY